MPRFPDRIGALLLAAAVAATGAAAAPQRISRADDKTPPTVRVVSPAPGERVERAAPDIEIAYEDDSSGVSVVTFRARVNDRDVSRTFEHHSRGATAAITPSQALPLGENHLVVEVADRAGNVGRADVTFINAAGGWLTVVADPGVGPARHAELILDASGSMNDAVLDNTRMAVAKSAIAALVKGLPDDTPLGLRVFTDCSTIRPLAPIARLDKPAFLKLVQGIEPGGGTPIVASLLQSFGALRTIPDAERISLIVTDGGESCSGSFAEVVEMAKEPPIRVIVIAFDIHDSGITGALRQLADASGGAFIDAQDGSQLQRALEDSLQRITYSVYDSAGHRLADAVVNGGKVMLPLGAYEVRFGFSSLRLSADVTIQPLVESTIRLHGQGRALAATLEADPQAGREQP